MPLSMYWHTTLISLASSLLGCPPTNLFALFPNSWWWGSGGLSTFSCLCGLARRLLWGLSLTMALHYCSTPLYSSCHGCSSASWIEWRGFNRTGKHIKGVNRCNYSPLQIRELTMPVERKEAELTNGIFRNQDNKWGTCSTKGGKQNGNGNTREVCCSIRHPLL